MSALISGKSLLMTATNDDHLYSKVLVKENSNSLRDLSRRRIHIRMSLIYLLVVYLFVFCCITVFVLFYFSLVYFQYMFFFSEHNHTQPIPVDSGPIINMRMNQFKSIVLTSFLNSKFEIEILKKQLCGNSLYNTTIYSINEYFKLFVKK